MSNLYFNSSGVPAAQTRGLSSTVRTEFGNVQAGFDKLPEPAVGADKGFVDPIIVGAPTKTTHVVPMSWVYSYTWNQDRNAGGFKLTNLGAPTVNSDAVTKVYADSLAFSSALPNQAGNAGGVVATDGSSAAWSDLVTVVSGVSVTASQGGVYVLTNASATTVSLPASPIAGGRPITIKVANGRVDNLVAGSGKSIEGILEDLVLDGQYVSIQLRYVDATSQWRLV